MFTIKRVIDGDTFLSEQEEPILSEKRTSGRQFFEAKKLYLEVPQAEGVELTAGDMAQLTNQKDDLATPGAPIREVITICEDNQLAFLEGFTGADQPSTVTLTMWSDGKETVAKANKPGDLRIDDVIAVLVSHSIGEDEGSFNTHYDFIYPGDEVYIVNRYGNTVASVR